MAIILDNRKQKREAGVALLIAVIFMSVMLAIGLALGSLSYKQQVLASGAIQSQYAFYAADAGLECALYGDQKLDLFNPFNGQATLSCDNQNFLISTTSVGTDIVSSARLTLDNNTRCADITVYKPSSGTGMTYIFSQGYDTSCSIVSSPSGARFVARGISTSF
jgi:Tfp pilus assembly protein PilX